MYDDLAESFHLIFENWSASIERQARSLGGVIEGAMGPAPLRILDCACGIGTQALGLASRGHRVTASDLSSRAVARARREAEQRGLAIRFHVADMRDLESVIESGFDVVLAADNAVPHLDAPDLPRAASAMLRKLRPGGLLVLTLRDYDRLVVERPTVQGPAFHSDSGRRRIVLQVWDWIAERDYTLHVYITMETASGWDARHFVSHYRALLVPELTQILRGAGFSDIRCAAPAETGFYQPVVLARR